MDVDEPRRNDVFDRELRRALAAEGGVTAGPHVDAELAAAWMDRQLDPVAARSIEAHLAGCQECQILMATQAPSIAGNLQGLLHRHDADILTVGPDQANFGNPNAFIDSKIVGAYKILLL